MPRTRETSRKRCQEFKRERFQGTGMPREMDVRKETCREKKRLQEKDMPRERETSRKRCQDFKRERDFNEKACREKRMSGKRQAERIRDLNQGKERRQEKKCQDFKRKRFQGKCMPRETDVRKE